MSEKTARMLRYLKAVRLTWQREYNSLDDPGAKLEMLERYAAQLGVKTSTIMQFISSTRPLTPADLEPPKRRQP